MTNAKNNFILKLSTPKTHSKILMIKEMYASFRVNSKHWVVLSLENEWHHNAYVSACSSYSTALHYTTFVHVYV